MATAELSAEAREILTLTRNDPDLAEIVAIMLPLAARHGRAFLEETCAAAQAGDRAEVRRICAKWAQA